MIPALQSRCTRFKFKPLPIQYVANKLKYVSLAESINIEVGTIEHLAKASDGDMRKGMNVLQSSVLLKGQELVTVDDIYLLTGVCHSGLIENI